LQRAAELAKQPAEINPTQIKRYALNRSTVAKEPAKNPALDMQPSSAAINIEENARLADSARRSGRLDEATALYQRGLQVRPDWQEGWRQLGTTEYMRSRFPEAITALRQSVVLDSKQPDTWTLLGLCEFQIKDYKNARIHLDRGYALGFSGNAAAVRFSRYHLALLRNLDGDFDGAINLLIPETGPGALAEEIQFAMGIALLRIPALPDQIDSAKRAIVGSAGEAAELLSRSYYDKAFQVFDQMLRENPGTPFLHYAYGDALASASKYDAAQSQLREETRLNLTSELANIRLASIELVLHQPEKAVLDSQKAVLIAPASAEAHYVLGRSLLEQADTAAAIRELETARRLAPDSAKVHFNLARAYSRANRTPEAEQERAEFQRLKEQKSASGSVSGRSVSAASSLSLPQPADDPDH
jgi:tetratricopeptide (TPR) repeat protein